MHTAAEWVDILCRPAGWDYTPPNGSVVLTTDDFSTQATEAMQGGEMQMAAGYVPPRERIPRRCDRCGKDCHSECMCGEVYCSRECQAQDWRNHRHICETVFENGTIAAVVTQTEMRRTLTSTQIAAAIGDFREPRRRQAAPHGHPANRRDPNALLNYEAHISTCDQLPMLWPRSPRWPDDPQLRDRLAALVPLPSRDLHMSAQQCKETGVHGGSQQRQLDDRMRHLSYLRDRYERSGEKHTSREWIELMLTASGWACGAGLRARLKACFNRRNRPLEGNRSRHPRSTKLHSATQTRWYRLVSWRWLRSTGRRLSLSLSFAIVAVRNVNRSAFAASRSARENVC